MPVENATDVEFDLWLDQRHFRQRVATVFVLHFELLSLSSRNVLRFAVAAIVFASAVSCGENPDTHRVLPPASEGETDSVSNPGHNDEDQNYRQRRTRMAEQQLAARDIVDRRVLEAMNRVARHEFVPRRSRHLAYSDSPLLIGHRQTISQPYIVALMTQLVRPSPQAKALDIGTGSGYQAAVLAELVKDVYSIEIVEPLAKQARARLDLLGYKNIHVRHGDGYRGWPEQAPFEIIIVAAAPDHVPQALVEQLSPGGKMVIPVGKFRQNLLVIEKALDGTVTQRNVAPVAFVPMTGEAQNRPAASPRKVE